MKSLCANVNEVKDTKGLIKEEETAVRVTSRVTALDREEIKNTHADKKKFLDLAMKYVNLQTYIPLLVHCNSLALFLSFVSAPLSPGTTSLV